MSASGGGVRGGEEGSAVPAHAVRAGVDAEGPAAPPPAPLSDSAAGLLTVVELVRSGAARTRTELAAATGWTRAVVTQRIDQAKRKGYLEDGPFAPSSGGRAPRTLRFRADQGILLVCVVGERELRVGVTDLEGVVLARGRRDRDGADGPEETVAAVIGLLDVLLEEEGFAARVWGVAVGVPGPVDSATGRPVASPALPGWDGADLRSRLVDRFDAPVWVDEDAHLLALAEGRSLRWGAGADLVRIEAGTRIAVSLLSRGSLLRGASGAAGDIGHLRVPGGTHLCRCGRTGCLEAEAGGSALVRDAHLAVADGRSAALARRAEEGGPLTPADVAAAAQDGDHVAGELVLRSAGLIGQAVATLVTVVGPSAVVVGGPLASAGELFLDGVRRSVLESSSPLATRDLLVVPSTEDDDALLVGGAELLRDQLFEVSFAQWFEQGHPSPSVMHARAGRERASSRPPLTR